MSKWKRKNRELLKMRKKSVCMPAHLDEATALHVTRQAIDRGWSNSQYLRWLAILDMNRCEDDSQLMSEATGIPRERFDLIERNERIKKA